MRKFVALILVLHLMGQWGVYRLTNIKPKWDDHYLYCFCQNCPGEPFCCCGKAQSQEEKIRLASVCDQVVTMLLTERNSLEVAITFFFDDLSHFSKCSIRLEPLTLKSPEFVTDLEKPPRLL